MADETLTGLELRSLATPEGELKLSLEEVAVAPPGPDELIVRVEAAPINPSDLGLLIGPADPSTLSAGGTAERPTLTLAIPPQLLRHLKPRLGQSLPVGNEGAGTVVQAGENVQAMLGKRVGLIGGATYATYRRAAARDAIPLPDDVSAVEGASIFVNPMTALAMVEVMRAEGHTAIVHTAAASNLGQMLVKICQADGVPLVAIVRSEAQAQLLRELGVTHVIDSSAGDFAARLTDAIAETGATIAFDAIGGGRLVNSILMAMEAAANRNATAYSRYGSTTFKQVYIYGGLDTGPTTLDRGFGFSWSVSGFLVTPALQKLGGEVAARMRARVVAELKTTFASGYTDTIGLAEALRPDILQRYNRKATGEKFLIDPTR